MQLCARFLRSGQRAALLTHGPLDFSVLPCSVRQTPSHQLAAFSSYALKKTHYVSLPHCAAQLPRSYSSMRVDPKLRLSYTCKICSTRNAKTISKQAYTKGVVIVQCEGCENRHLIADHLGWWKELSDRGIHDIEDIMREKGESVTKVTALTEKDLEVVPNEGPPKELEVVSDKFVE